MIETFDELRKTFVKLKEINKLLRVFEKQLKRSLKEMIGLDKISKISIYTDVHIEPSVGVRLFIKFKKKCDDEFIRKSYKDVLDYLTTRFGYDLDMESANLDEDLKEINILFYILDR